MERRNILIIVLSAAILGVCALCGVSTFGAFRWYQNSDMRFDRISVSNVASDVEETFTYDLTGPLDVVLDTYIGNISVTGGETDQVRLKVIRTGFGKNEADAQAAAEALEVEIEQTGNTLTARYKQPASAGFYRTGPSDRVTFFLTVPKEADMSLHSGAGDVFVSDITGNAVIQSSFGSARVTNLNGALEMTSSGNLILRDIQAGTGDIRIETNFGDIEATNLQADEIHIQANTGNLTVRGLAAAGDIYLGATFSNMDVQDVQASALRIENQTGAVKVSHGRVKGAFDASTTFGNVDVVKVAAASYTMDASTGSVTLNEASGPCRITSSFGSIDLTGGQNVILTAEARSGSVSFSGSLDGNASHSIITSFGDISLTLPETSAFDLDLKTQFGDIDSQLPLTFSGKIGSDSSNDKQYKAKVNGGGPLLKAHAQTGSISIRAPGN